MKILVTGGAGFIASNVVDRYIDLGHEVIVVDDLSAGRREHVNPRAKFIQMSILDDDLVKVFLEHEPAVISHHAAQVNVRKSVDDPDYDARINILGSIRVYKCAAAVGCRKIIYSSSGGACYGEPKNLPAGEGTPIHPLCPYGTSKYAAEKYLELFAELYDMTYTVLRYANVYGPRQDPHGEAGVVAIFAEMLLDGKRPSIFGDGSKTRDYVFVEDIAQANVLALGAGEGGTYNIGTGRQIADDEVFTTVRDAIGVSIKPIYTDFRKGEVRYISLDASRARRDLGWAARISFADGIRQAVDYYRQKRSH